MNLGFLSFDNVFSKNVLLYSHDLLFHIHIALQY
jgi:hypothetical protein